MKLILNTELPRQQGYIDYSSSLISIGSCFSDSIGEKLSNSGFEIHVNPTGIIFNPASVLKVLQNALTNSVHEAHVIERDESWLSYDFHSEISAESEDQLKQSIRKKNLELAAGLKTCTHLLITFGTAWAYQLKRTGEIVANCHKTNQVEFDKLLLNQDKLFGDWAHFIGELFEINPKLKILFTISPVRHAKDGLRENNVSKGILHELVYNLEAEFDDVNYFPSYEILIDELRDYRYYSSDLVHPSDVAVDYIWTKFQNSYFTDSAIEIVQLYAKLNQAKSHRFMNAGASQMVKHQEFILQLEEKIKKLKA